RHDPHRRTERYERAETLDVLVAERDAALRPVERARPAPASPLAVEAEMSAEGGLLRRHAARAMRAHDRVALGRADPALGEGALGVGDRGIVDGQEAVEAP